MSEPAETVEIPSGLEVAWNKWLADLQAFGKTLGRPGEITVDEAFFRRKGKRSRRNKVLNS